MYDVDVVMLDVFARMKAELMSIEESVPTRSALGSAPNSSYLKSGTRFFQIFRYIKVNRIGVSK